MGLLRQHVAQQWHLVVELDLLLAAWAVKEAEGDAQCGPPVREQLHDAVGVEDVSA